LLYRSEGRRVTREISRQGGRQLPGWQQWTNSGGTHAEAA
jgi:hypothetical protein